MVRIRSRLVRRGRTGRKSTGTHLVRRRVKVHKHHPRRYAGIRGGRPSKPRVRKSHKSRAAHRAAVTHKKRRSLHKRHMRKGLHRHFKGRKKSTHKRHLKSGLHRHFHGRRKVQRRHGLHHPHKGSHGHRKFHGRRNLHSAKRNYERPTPPPAISSASYLSMF